MCETECLAGKVNHKWVSFNGEVHVTSCVDHEIPTLNYSRLAKNNGKHCFLYQALKANDTRPIERCHQGGELNLTKWQDQCLQRKSIDLGIKHNGALLWILLAFKLQDMVTFLQT